MGHRISTIFGLLLSVSILMGCSVPLAQTTQLPTENSHKGEIQVTATQEPPTPTSTPTFFAQPTATAAPLASGRLAYLEGSQLAIVDLGSGSAIRVDGAYRQLQGWSPSGDYLLASAEDGENAVVDANGEVVTTLPGLSQPAFWAAPNALADPEDWLALPKTDGAFELLSFPSQQTQLILEPSSLGADGLADVRWGANGAWIVTPSLMQLQNQVSNCLISSRSTEKA